MVLTSDVSNRVPGWGVDLDPARRPGVPKLHRPLHGTGAHWQQPEHQYPRVKIHKSIERPGITPVFGTTYPPRGLSGKIRDFAYTLGEGVISRWMLLLFADRVDVVEGLLEDLGSGRLPNLLRETGWMTEFKYNKKGVVIAVGAVGLGIIGYLAIRATREETA